MLSSNHHERLPDAFLSDLRWHWTKTDEQWARGAYLAALAKGQVQPPNLTCDSMQNTAGPSSASSQTWYMMPPMPHSVTSYNMDVDMTSAGEYGSVGTNIAQGFGESYDGYFYDYTADPACVDASSYYEDDSPYADDSSCYEDHSPYTDDCFDVADSPYTNEASSSSSSCATPSLSSSRGHTTGSPASSVSFPSAGERSLSPTPTSPKKVLVYPVAPYYKREDRPTHANDPDGFFWCRWRGDCNFAFHHKDSNGVYLAHFQKEHKDVPKAGLITCQWCDKKEVVKKAFIGNHIHKALGARTWHRRDMIIGPLPEN